MVWAARGRWGLRSEGLGRGGKRAAGRRGKRKLGLARIGPVWVGLGFLFSGFSTPFLFGLVGSMPLQFLEVGFHVEIHDIEWHDFEHETQFYGVVVA